jgi:radical SAM/SPASM domain protein of ACGX system
VFCINRAGIRSVIMTTVSKTNMSDMPGIIDAVVKAGVNVFAFSRYVPSGGDLDASMTPMEYRSVLAACDKKFKEYEAAGCETYFNKKDHLWTLYEYETGEFKLPENMEEGMIYGGCNCGNCHITILPTGDIYACRRVAESKVGNVFCDRLADVWLGKMENYREYTKFTKCSKCELLAFCRGCPAVAKGTNGSFYEEDPQCWKATSDAAD